MFTLGFAAFVGAVFTVGSYISAGVNTINLAYDQSIVADSLTQMNDTANQLKQKAMSEPDPDLREQKLLVAQKLSQTQTQLSGLQNQILVNGARKEALALSKSIISGSLDGTIGIVDSIADQAVAAKGEHNSKVSDVTIWSKLAKSSESLDAEILKIKTRRTLQDLSAVNDELANMVRSFQDQEKQGQLDSDQFEEKIGELIESKPELNDFVLSGLDVDPSFDNSPEVSKVSDQVVDEVIDEVTNQEITPDQIEAKPGKTIYGDWVLLETKASGTNLDYKQKDNVYRFTTDGKYLFIDGIPTARTLHYLYQLENNQITITKIVNVTGTYVDKEDPASLKWYVEHFEEFSYEYLPEKDQIIRYSSDNDIICILTRK